MIVKEEEALARLHSPMNLMNRLRESNGRSKAMSLFTGGNNGVRAEQVKSPVVLQTASLIIKDEPTDEEKRQIQEDFNGKEDDKISIDKLIDNAETQITLADAHNRAVDLLQKTVITLAGKIDDLDADKLPSVINAASRVVNDIRKERADAAKTNLNTKTTIIFYTPEQRKISDYSVIDV